MDNLTGLVNDLTTGSLSNANVNREQVDVMLNSVSNFISGMDDETYEKFVNTMNSFMVEVAEKRSHLCPTGPTEPTNQ